MTAPIVATATAPAPQPVYSRLPQVLREVAGWVEDCTPDSHVMVSSLVVHTISGSLMWPDAEDTGPDALLWRRACRAVAEAAGLRCAPSLAPQTVQRWGRQSERAVVVSVLRSAAVAAGEWEQGMRALRVVDEALARLAERLPTEAGYARSALVGDVVAALNAAGRALRRAYPRTPQDHTDRLTVLAALEVRARLLVAVAE